MRISTIVKGLGFLAATYLSYNLALVSNQRRLVFNPTKEEPHCPVLTNHRPENIALEFAPEQFVRGVLYAPKDSQEFDVLVYFPGRSEDSSWLCLAANWISPETGLVSINYRGSGLSDGKPGEREVVEDGCRLLNRLARDKRIRRIHLIGRSLGTGVAIQVQSLNPIASTLSLITPYDSIIEIAKKRFPLAPVNWLLKYRFDSLAHCKEVLTKTLVIVAEKDDVVPFSSTQSLMRSWPAPFKSVQIIGSDHINIPHLPVVWSEIEQFIKSTEV